MKHYIILKKKQEKKKRIDFRKDRKTVGLDNEEEGKNHSDRLMGLWPKFNCKKPN